jgi:hypothetical protein
MPAAIQTDHLMLFFTDNKLSRVCGIRQYCMIYRGARLSRGRIILLLPPHSDATAVTMVRK